MAVTVETLEKLERKITLSLPVDVITKEVDVRLKRVARQVKIDGFRPGKVPMNIVAQRYGYSTQFEVMNDKVGEAFAVATNEAKLRVAGQPRITEKEGAPEGQMQFDAIFGTAVADAGLFDRQLGQPHVDHRQRHRLGPLMQPRAADRQRPSCSIHWGTASTSSPPRATFGIFGRKTASY